MTYQPQQRREIDFADAGLPGVKVEFAPIDKATVREARKMMQAAIAKMVEEGADPDGLEVLEAATEIYSEVLIRRGIRAWSGIGWPGEDPEAVTPERVEAFIRDARLFGAADDLYSAPFIFRETEKNGSALSPNGTSAGATAARPTARTAARKAVKSAHTSATRRERTKVRTPGTS